MTAKNRRGVFDLGVEIRSLIPFQASFNRCTTDSMFQMPKATDRSAPGNPPGRTPAAPGYAESSTGSPLFGNGLDKFGSATPAPDGQRLLMLRHDAGRGVTPYVFRIGQAPDKRAVEIPGMWGSPVWR
jgi:hypothetical protein